MEQCHFCGPWPLIFWLLHEKEILLFWSYVESLCLGSLANTQIICAVVHPSWFNLHDIFFFFLLGPHLQHIEVPRLVVESELQLLVYATTTATWDPRCICSLYQSFRQCWIRNPVSEGRDRTRILVDTSQEWNPLSHRGNSLYTLFYVKIFKEK